MLNAKVVTVGYDENDEYFAVACVGCRKILDPFGGKEFPNTVVFPDSRDSFYSADCGLCADCAAELLALLSRK
jgi:hypothetical protein